MIKLAAKRYDFEHFDAYNALFYNADALGGLCKREFDLNYILWFLTRFYCFLELLNCENPCIVRENALLASDLDLIFCIYPANSTIVILSVKRMS
jgi:hypothetical protein